jgi:RimJ/RimL family protein N-acetyltransferase
MEPTLRASNPDDAAAISELLNRCYGKWHWLNEPPRVNQRQVSLRIEAESENAWTFVADDKEGLIGVVYVADRRKVPNRPELGSVAGWAHLGMLFVDPGYWGTGLASQLNQLAIAHMERSGYSDAQLWTPKANLRAIRFYQREGWLKTGDEQMTNQVIIRFHRQIKRAPVTIGQ